MLLRDHYYSANKCRTVEIKKFSIGAGTTAALVPKRLCLVVSSRSVRRQPEKLGRRWWKVVYIVVMPGTPYTLAGRVYFKECFGLHNTAPCPLPSHPLPSLPLSSHPHASPPVPFIPSPPLPYP